jgi:hypothetical protein
VEPCTDYAIVAGKCQGLEKVDRVAQLPHLVFRDIVDYLIYLALVPGKVASYYEKSAEDLIAGLCIRFHEEAFESGVNFGKRGKTCAHV